VTENSCFAKKFKEPEFCYATFFVVKTNFLQMRQTHVRVSRFMGFRMVNVCWNDNASVHNASHFLWQDFNYILLYFAFLVVLARYIKKTFLLQYTAMLLI